MPEVSQSMLQALADIANEQENVQNPDTPPEPIVEPVVPPADEPKTLHNEDGSSVVIEKSSKGWKATLDTGTGAKSEVFYGATKDELFINLANSKVNATKKIREQNRQLKLGGAKTEVPATPKTPVSTRELTAEEKLELQLASATDMSAAFDSYFEKRFGMTPEKMAELAKKSEKGEVALRNLQMEDVARTFVNQTKDYFPDSQGKNYQAIIGLMAKQKLGTTMTDKNADQVLNSLVDQGFYTVENLTDAYEELSEDGLILFAPKVPDVPAPPEPPPVIPPTTVVVTPPAENNTVRRPRAGFGLMSKDVSTSAPSADQPPSADDFNQMSDAELKAALDSVRRLKR